MRNVLSRISPVMLAPSRRWSWSQMRSFCPKIKTASPHVGCPSDNEERFFKVAELPMSKVNANLRKLLLYFWGHVGKRNQRTGRNHCQRKQYGGSSRQRFIGSFRHTGDDRIDGKDGKAECGTVSGRGTEHRRYSGERQAFVRFSCRHDHHLQDRTGGHRPQASGLPWGML